MPAMVASTSDPNLLQRAESLFSAGRFEAATPLLQTLVNEADAAGNAGAPDAAARIARLRLAQLALLANRPLSALGELAQLPAPLADSDQALRLHAIAAYRAGRLDEAAASYHRLGRHGLAGVLTRLAHAYADNTAATAPAGTPGWCLDWLRHQPLPVIRAELNGEAAHLVIDTGCAELMLDTAMAGRLGLSAGAPERAELAGGHGSVAYGILAELGLGNARLHQLPVQLSALDAVFRPFFPDLPIHGILGCAVLSRFHTRLDYAARALHLTVPNAAAESGLATTAAKRGTPFWLAGLYTPVARAQLNGHYTCQCFLDTGMSGAALALAPSSLPGLGLTPADDDTHTGYSAGGTISVPTLTLDEVVFAGHTRRSLPALVLPHFALEHRFGFRIGGLLAHDFFAGGSLSLDFHTMHLVFEHHDTQ